ncbi:uncharacterized protein LOC120492801 [Pimephales promelas]|uniref:uncharacterized protein LOC120492801 n=1 Tax=Pimephales promelas TaxID=90988 RepID=UPI00195564D7|nr:uncharacterized protein LOC120492801 [Pimephales promelas]XP_039546988.1 uncharacterized protein LOC120492801 [Pimephales promelas]
MMTDKASKSCTPVKEMDASKPSQSSDTDDEIEDHSDGVKTDEVRRSRRKRIPTEKMVAYQREESQKAEKRLMHSYEQWKAEARKAREQLKTDISESQLATLIDTLENERDNVMNAYMRVRSCVTPPTDTRRRIDACDAVTKDIVKIAYERISGVDGDLDVETKKERLRELLDRDYARSVYGSTVSRISSKSSTPISQPSLNSILMAKRIEAEAELAAKEAEYAAIMEEKEQRERIQLLEERQKRELDAQKSEYERLLAVKEVRAARARLKVYDKGDVSSDDQNDVLQQPVSIPTQVYSSSIEPTLNAKASSPTTNVDVSYLAQAVQDSITLNRLPMPEPTVFSGDPIHFIEWKASFQSLIDKRHISSADKLYYLKKYVTGSARKTLEGMFYRNDEEAYKDAWKRLQDRYGQPFIVQRAFREKLACWPRIQPKDAEGLRNFSDFLNACKDAMPHVKGLEILNDCEENRKLVSKLPDWAAARWNRQATQTLNETQEFPPFHDFAKFMSLEAEVACNPVTSFYALHASEANKDKQNLKVSKNKANVFHTKIITQNEDPKHTGKVFKPCLFCRSSEHQIHDCSKFSARSLEERRQFVKDSKLCYGCLKLSHSARDCRSRHNCVICKGRHPTCLHDDSFIRRVKFSPAQSPENTHERVVTTSLSVESGCASANTSMIVPVWLSSQNDPTSERLVYALLDTQSDTVFVEYAVSQSLKVDSCPVTLRLTTMVGRDSLISSERVSGLRVRGFNSTVILDLPPAYTKECIPVDRAHIPTSETARCWKHLAPLADRIPLLQDCEVGLLLGYNCPRALAPREVILGADNEPYGVRTDLGWSIVGPSLTHESQSGVSMCHRVSIKEIPSVTPADVIKVLESDFRDTKENTKVVSQEDIVFLNKLEENIKTNEDGHLEMPLPFKKRPYLPDNEVLAVMRLQHLKRRLIKDQEYRDHYVKFMEDVIENGDAERIMDEGKKGEKWYIPHHGVYHSKKPGKLRVVFDCSARYKGSSLNDHLLPGPDLMNSLTGILLRFRQYPVALTCDIERMFHQFHVDKADRDYLRFLWWRNGDLDSQPQTFRMRVHLFGASSSPGCANYGLKHLAREGEHLYPLGSQFIMRDFYMDDGVSSVECAEKAIQSAREARQVCALGGLRLHKFVSNNKAVLESIPPSECAVDVTAVDLSLTDQPLERALGIYWHLEDDNFRFRVNLKDQPATRRGILSVVASLFDPLGFLAPFLLKGKAILQEMCVNGMGWDDPLPDSLRPRWEHWKADLANLEKIEVPRCIVPAGFQRITKREIHHFSDASTKGYGQCSYLRLENEQGDVHCSLLMAKSRVAPLKVTTIPRLELTAAVVSVAVNDMLKEEMNLADAEAYFWTDSQVVLGYINNEARRFHTFVANRVQRIHHSTSPQQWRYIPSDENPADYASRGMSVDDLVASSWFRGPKVLWKRQIAPPVDVNTQLPIGDPEVKKAQSLNTQTVQNSCLSNRLTRLSSWSKVIQAVARLLRRVRKDKSSDHSTVAEREDAKSIIIKDLQSQTYAEEIALLRKGKQLSRNNRLYNLDAFVDHDGLLKVGGRLCNSSVPYSIKYPVILPKEHHLTKLLIADCHEKTEHQGKGLTINEIRSRGYWITGVNRAVASFVRRCVGCRKLRRPTEEQKMANLPSERLDPSPPFTYCGMDVFGPFIIKQSRKSYKRYGLLFTCFCCRGIHIEMLDDMSTDAFINGLRCFIAIRGAVRLIRCDQGSNFIGAKNEFAKAMTEIDTNRLVTYLAGKQCDFVFNAPHSSHTGGVWERQIRTVRSVLNSTLSLSSGRLDDSSLRTFFYEAMAIVNSRPLTVDNLNDPKSPEPLTPNHLLTLKTTQALPPPGKFVREDVYARKRWRHVQYLAEQFWGRWQKEYVSNIATRQRWLTPRRNMQVGDIVLEKADDLPRNEWRLAKVIETVVDKDGLVRRAKIRFGDRKLGKDGKRLNKPSIVDRPVQKLVLLLEAS